MDSTSIAALVGERVVATGAEIRMRLTNVCSLVMTNVFGRYAESTRQNRTWHISTGVAGVAPGIALSTSPPMVIYNPINSGVNLSINQVRVGYVSGTLGAGTLVHAWVQNLAKLVTPGTALTPVPGFLGEAKPKFSAYQSPTLPLAPTIITPSIMMGAILNTSVFAPIAPAYDEVDGSIIIPPGTIYALQMIGTAGTTPLVMIGVQLEEMPIPVS